MDRLRSQAVRTGGVVLSNLGNHEWMNAIGTVPSINLLYYIQTLLLHTGDWR